MLRTPIDEQVVCQILRTLRVKRKLSLRELAKRTGYSALFISHTEHSNTIDFSVLIRLLDAMNYDLMIVPRDIPTHPDDTIATKVKNDNKTRRN